MRFELPRVDCLVPAGQAYKRSDALHNWALYIVWGAVIRQTRLWYKSRDTSLFASDTGGENLPVDHQHSQILETVARDYQRSA